MAEQTNKSTDPRRRWTGRLPIGLIVTTFALACSLGAMLICWNLHWPSNNPLILIVHASAALCLIWSAVSLAVAQFATRITATPAGRDLLSAMQIVQTTFALLAVIIMLYVALASVFTRIPSLPFFRVEPQIRVDIWTGGLVDLAMVCASMFLTWRLTGSNAIGTCILWLGVLASLWVGLRIPDAAVLLVNGISREVWIDWVSPFVLGSAVSVMTLTLLREWLTHRRRAAAWPDRLNDLLTPYPNWPGFGFSAGIIAAMILVLGCMMIVSPLTVLSGLLAGISMLVLAHRHWGENFADAGLGLITLSVLSAIMPDLPQHGMSQSERFPAIFSRAVLGLAIMTYFWHWLAIVWEQQLDQGKPWTTAGRLIRPCRRVGFIVAATGVLVSLQLAIWPILPYVDKPDNSLSRWVAGLLPSLLLVGGCMWATRKTRKPTIGWLAMIALLSATAFVLIRIPGTAPYILFLTYWPLVLAGVAGLCLPVARGCLRSTAFSPFFEPIYVAGILLLPMTAIAGTSILASRAVPFWVDSATFIALTAVYLLAAFTIGPRRVSILAVICAAAAFASLRGF